MIMQPPASFLTAMEDYVKDAPRASVRKDKVCSVIWSLLDKDRMETLNRKFDT